MVTEDSTVEESQSADGEVVGKSCRSNDVSFSTEQLSTSHQTEEQGVVLRPKKKQVSFGSVSCRLYERTVGIHPDVSSGPALTFNWDYEKSPDLPLEEYEAHQDKRLTRSQMLIPRSQRTKILMRECGLSRTSIASHVREVNKLKAQRCQTIQNLKFEKMEERLQSFRKSVSRALFLRRSHETEMKLLWKNAEELGSSISTADLSFSSSSRVSPPSRSNLKTSSLFADQDEDEEDIAHHKAHEYLDDNTAPSSLGAYNDLDRARHGKNFDLGGVSKCEHWDD